MDDAYLDCLVWSKFGNDPIPRIKILNEKKRKSRPLWTPGIFYFQAIENKESRKCHFSGCDLRAAISPTPNSQSHLLMVLTVL